MTDQESTTGGPETVEGEWRTAAWSDRHLWPWGTRPPLAEGEVSQ